MRRIRDSNATLIQQKISLYDNLFLDQKGYYSPLTASNDEKNHKMIHNEENNTLEEQQQQQQEEEEEEEILEERETLHRELMYLLSNETPEIWNQLINQLTVCSLCFHHYTYIYMYTYMYIYIYIVR